MTSTNKRIDTRGLSLLLFQIMASVYSHSMSIGQRDKTSNSCAAREKNRMIGSKSRISSKVKTMQRKTKQTKNYNFKLFITENDVRRNSMIVRLSTKTDDSTHAVLKDPLEVGTRIKIADIPLQS